MVGWDRMGGWGVWEDGERVEGWGEWKLRRVEG